MLLPALGEFFQQLGMMLVGNVELILQVADVPLGLIAATWGGSPIEYWLPQSDPADPNRNACEVDEPQCVPKFPLMGNVSDSAFFSKYVRPLAPYTVSALIWDQAERDVKCPRSLAHYPPRSRFPRTAQTAYSQYRARHLNRALGRPRNILCSRLSLITCGIFQLLLV